MQLFRTLPIARDVFRVLPERAHGYARDTITIGWEERLRARGRRFSDQGLAFATTLPRGTILRAGDWLLVDEHQVAIEVVEHAEPVLVVTPKSAVEWGLFGYLIGNSHQPIMITPDAIVCADLPGMEQVLTYHNIEFARGHQPFTPVAMNVDHQHRPR